MKGQKDVSDVYARITQKIKMLDAGHNRTPHVIIFIILISVLTLSWFLKSNEGFKGGILLLFLYLLYLFCIGLRKIEVAINEFQRRRELERLPLFSLRGKTLRMEEKGAAVQEKPLDALDSVLVITTDQGPFICDNFLTLVFHDGSQWSIPLENPSHRNFYDALGKVLSFDGEQALFAACSTADGIFTLWASEAASITAINTSNSRLWSHGEMGKKAGRKNHEQL